MNKQGFTLIELLIVIGIIGILATVAITSYVGSMLKADRAEAYTNLNSLRLVEEQFFAENANYTAVMGNLPGFQPGTSLAFTYAITQNVQITGGGNNVTTPPTTGALTPCFVATATGITGTRPGNQEDIFVIDCNNNKNF